MPHFLVKHKQTGKTLFTYEDDVENRILGGEYSEDEMEHVKITDGEFGDILKLEKSKEVKEILKQKLAEHDWTQLNDSYLTDQNISEFKTYRDQLRKKLDQAEQDPWSVVIPVAPDEIKKPEA